MENTCAVIMAGGVGSRFWPSSRAQQPKQLLDIDGSGRSMIQATVDRLAPHIPPERVFVVTGRITREAVRAHLPQVPEQNILAEPQGRNTAPCIGWAAVHVRNQYPDAVMAVMPADHLIADVPAFHKALAVAVDAARKGHIVTFGIRPSGPDTGFGYIDTGAQVAPDVLAVNRFVEKPDKETATAYVAAGNYYWNSGMFFFSVDKILAEIATHLPDLHQGLRTIEEALQSGREGDVLDAVFPTLPNISIDYGVMERAQDIWCVPADFGWSDVGSWSAAYDIAAKDAQGNAAAGAVVVDAAGNLVRAPKDKLVALVGVDDLVVVDTPDALLVLRRDKAQDVKQVVARIKEMGRTDLL